MELTEEGVTLCSKISCMTKLCVDQKKCIGCMLCNSLAPKSFKMGKNGKSEPINPPGDKEKDIQNAINSCPVSAISQK